MLVVITLFPQISKLLRPLLRTMRRTGCKEMEVIEDVYTFSELFQTVWLASEKSLRTNLYEMAYRTEFQKPSFTSVARVGVHVSLKRPPLRTLATTLGWKQAMQVPPGRRTLG